MSKKDFSRGVQAAINAQQGFNEKQARATEELGKRIVKKIDDLGNIIDVVLSDLNAQEKERLYSITEQFDPKDLDGNEKELLVSLVYTLSLQHGQNSPQQMDYYYNLKKYLEVANPSGNCDLSCVENIENVSESKGIHAIVCEFLFLKHGDHSYRDEFSGFLDNFYVKPKDIKQVEEQINIRYDILGAEDIVRHFDIGYDPLSEVSDDIEAPDGSGVSYKDLSEIKYNGDRLAAMKLPEFHLERSYTSPQQITRKSIKLDSMTSISAAVSFKECIISYEVGKGGKLILSNGASASFVDCCFLCSGGDQKKSFLEDGDYLISSDGTAENIELLRCSFNHCTGFIQNLRVNSLSFKECYIVSPVRFLKMDYYSNKHSGEIAFDNNIVIDFQSKREDTTFDFRYEYSTTMHNNLFATFDMGSGAVRSGNTTMEGLFSSMSSVFSGTYMISIEGKLNMQNCTFYNTGNCVTASYCSEDCIISNCEFINCSDVVEKAANINDCSFVGCKGTTIKTSFDMNIRNCSFLSCVGQVLRLDTGAKVSNCEFKHIKSGRDAVIRTGSNPYHHDYHSTIEYCTFDDIDLGDEYLAECGTEKKRNYPALYFKDCSFSNIHTQRGDREIIRQYYTVGVFSSTTKNVDVNNCSGVGNADNGKLSDSKPVYSKDKSNGDKFGAIFPESFCEKLEKGYFKKNCASDSETILTSIREQIVKVMKKSKYGQMIDTERDDGRMRQTNIYLIMGFDHGNSVEKVLNTFIQDQSERKSENILGGYGIGVTSGYINGLAKMVEDMGKSAAFKTFDEIYGLLFCKDRFYFIENSGNAPQDMAYLDVAKVERNGNAINITSNKGEVISVKGEKVTDENIFNLFEYIVKIVNA